MSLVIDLCDYTLGSDLFAAELARWPGKPTVPEASPVGCRARRLGRQPSHRSPEMMDGGLVAPGDPVTAQAEDRG
ncbi:MAG TPA: hypothetical protein VKA15_25075, partial [Isosphaeraceae bacterium]|nr:hypothetical protein [Isosphaeraceae bacterium]